MEFALTGGFSALLGIAAGLITTFLLIEKERKIHRHETFKANLEIVEMQDKVVMHKNRCQELREAYYETQQSLLAEMNKANYFETKCRMLEQKAKQAQSAKVDISEEDKEAISKALKKAMFDSHPDRNGGNNDGSFQKYNELYKKYK